VRTESPASALRGIIVGEVVDVLDHPRAEKIWLAHIYLGHGDPVQIVFGGLGKVVRKGCLVPVAPPGSRIPDPAKPNGRKMRRRTYRGQPSHGMLCSLAELGWDSGVTNQVAIFADGSLKPGDSLDGRGGQWLSFTLPPIPDDQYESRPELLDVITISGPVPCAVPA
jgi:tRNA-binding EMAP/Myf-like protein